MGRWPAAFVQRMQSLLGKEFDAFLQSLEIPSPTAIRFNPDKPVARETPPFYPQIGERVAWCDQGYYLKERPIFTLDPLLHAGGYYVQEASSMFLQTVLRQITGEAPLRALDLCAAPGGKSTLLAANLPRGSLLIANETIKSRAAILKENMIKWGSDHTVVTSGDPLRFAAMKGAFDLLVVDAPCSGEGMFRKTPKAVEEWSEKHLHLCEERQKRILSDCWDSLAPGGYLIYSTCTYNPGENEGITDWLTRTFPARAVEVRHHFDGITPGESPLPCYRFYPHRVDGEGFFMAVFQKEEGLPYSSKKERRHTPSPVAILPPSIRDLIPNPSAYTPYRINETLGVVPQQHHEFIQHLDQHVEIIYRGCEIGESMKGKIKYAHALALFSGLQKTTIPTQEIDLQSALKYLRKEEIHFDAPAGEWILITYHSLPIGWVKEVGNRLNNYYPKEWRIRIL